MPDPEPLSPWSPPAHPRTVESHAAASGVAAQPAHAWISADPYAVAPAAPVALAAAAAPVAAPAGPAAPYAGPPIEVHVTAPSSGRGLALLGVVLGGLALLSMGLVLVLVVFVGFMDDGSGGGYAPLRGTIAPVAGSALTGAALADEVTKKLTDDGAEPDDVTCPETPKVGRDVTTVCHGTDFGDDAAFVVFFEDETGAYTLLEI